MTLRLSEHLTLDEVLRTSKPIRNVPGPSELWALMHLARFLFEPLRRHIGPMRVTSGYRCAALNDAVGGAKASQHTKGQALDVKPLRMTSRAAFAVLERLVLADELPLDQGILYAPSRGGHIHLSHRVAGRNRRELRKAPSSGGYPLWDGEL